MTIFVKLAQQDVHFEGASSHNRRPLMLQAYPGERLRDVYQRRIGLCICFKDVQPQPTPFQQKLRWQTGGCLPSQRAGQQTCLRAREKALRTTTHMACVKSQSDN